MKSKLSYKIKQILIKLLFIYIYIGTCIRLTGLGQSLINIKSVKNYKCIVKDFSEFLSEQDINTPIEIFDYFNFALWNGYLSYDRDFKFTEKRELYLRNAGVGCIQGNAVCFNNADFLTKLFKEYGFNAYSINCYCKAERVDQIRTNEYIYRTISYKEKKENILVDAMVEGISLVVGNHAITCVEYEGELYYFDPTNFVYLGKNGLSNLEILNGEGEFEIKYISSSIYHSLNLFLDTFQNSPESFNLEYLKSLNNTEIYVKDLDEFYEKENPLYEAIHDNLDGKHQILFIMLSSVLSSFIFTPILNTIKWYSDDKKIKLKKELYKIISNFFNDNEIYNIKKMCSYLSYMIDNGYLSVDCENDKYKVKVTLSEETPALAIVDSEYKVNMLVDFMNSRLFTSTIIDVKDENNFRRDVIMFEDSQDNAYFYLISENKFLLRNSEGNLVDGNKIYKVKSKEVLEHIKNMSKIDKISNDIIIDDELCKEFNENNQNTILSVSKKLAYIKRKKD